MFRFEMIGLFALACALAFAPRSAYAEQSGVVSAKGIATASTLTEALSQAAVELKFSEEQISQQWESKGYWVDWGTQRNSAVQNADGTWTATATAPGFLSRIP